ncbi:hypothetical protein [Paenibacillus lutrae]|uniref:Uncharacterized protein n=1 Tax=Paenibacillus lutrae TaxID=2078573 RepID=A0A7X3FIH7_9BACL|nr:hypothetical protein [Paenibacillus lutrae]MVP00320.1 hypothetical protein [Paenibacillus lutrae]
MFDPTIYENLKVVLEGAVYDLDLSGDILVTNRSDQIDMSTLSRNYAIRFVLQNEEDSHASPWAEFALTAGLEDLAAEILERKPSSQGCTLTIRFGITMEDPQNNCPAIAASLASIWSGRPTITQTLSYVFGQREQCWHNDVLLEFGRKLDESHVGDFTGLLEHTVKTLSLLREKHAA